MSRVRAVTAAISVIAASGVCVETAVASAATRTSTVTKYATGTTNVRAGAGTGYRTVGSLSAGDVVTGKQQGNGWIVISSPSRLAGKYVSGAVLAAAKPSAPKSATPAAGTVTGWVVGDYHVKANVRSAPSLSSPVVAKADKGTKLTGQLTSGWLKTAQGYVNAGVLEFDSADIYANNARLKPSELCTIPTAYNAPTSFSVVSPDTGRRYSYDRSTVRYLSCAALPSLIALENAYVQATGHVAQIDLGYRGWDEQRAWATDKRYNGSPAGRSNHGWGLAVDFKDDGSADNGRNEFASRGAGFSWLTKNAAAFGYAVDPVVPERLSYWKSETFHWNFVG